MRAVLFDLDETLMPDLAATEAAALAAGELARSEYGVDPRSLYRALRAHASRLWRASPTIGYARAMGIASWEGLWGRFDGDGADLFALRSFAPAYRRAAWSSALADHGVDDAIADQLTGAFVDERRTRQQPYPEAPGIVAELAERHRLALITNGAPDLQLEKLDRSGLGRYFDPVLISAALGIGKPDPRIFARALAALGIGAHDAVMVGDSLERDIAGARASGIASVWVVREGVADAPADRHPDAHIADLRELPAVIERLSVSSG